MANTGFKGIDVRQTGNQLVFRAFLTTSGAVLTSGTGTLELYEIQSDGTLKSYDFSDNTFKTTTLTTATLALTHRTGNNSATNTGIWTAVLSTLTGFTAGGMYLSIVRNSSADTPVQAREFQYGSEQGDQVVTAISTGVGAVNVNTTHIGGNVNAGAPGSVNVSSLNSNTIRLATMYQDVRPLWQRTLPVGTAVTVDPTAGQWYWGGIYNGIDYFIFSALYLWNNGGDSWVISSNLGVASGKYFTSSTGILGTWAANGSATGTPVFKLNGLPLGQYFSSLVVNSAGYVLADLYAILGTVLTETAGQIAAGFKKFFNVPVPTSTMNQVTLVDTATTTVTATNLTNAPTNGDFTSTMKTSLNAATPTVTVSGASITSIASAVWSTIIASGTMAGTIMSSLLSYLTNYVAAPTAVENRQEMDANSAKLAAAATEANATSNKDAVLSAIGGLPTTDVADLIPARLKMTIDLEDTTSGWPWVKDEAGNSIPTAIADAKDEVLEAIGDIEVGGGSTIQNNIAISPAVSANAQSPAIITVVAHVTLSIELPLLGDISDRTSLTFAIKAELTDDDDDALIMLSESGGLLRVAGESPASSDLGSLTVLNASTGSVRIALNPSITGLLEMTDGRRDMRYWGAKYEVDNDAYEPQSGRVIVTSAVDQGV